MPSHSVRKPSGGLVLLRISLGLLLLSWGWHATRTGEPTGPWIEEQVQARLGELPGLIAWWGDSILLYNPAGIAFLASWGAVGIGVLLLLGALTRPTGWIGATALVHIAIYTDANNSSLIALAAVCALACALSCAGHSVGLDRMLDSALPSWLTWANSEHKKAAY